MDEVEKWMSDEWECEWVSEWEKKRERKLKVVRSLEISRKYGEIDATHQLHIASNWNMSHSVDIPSIDQSNYETFIYFSTKVLPNVCVRAAWKRTFGKWINETSLLLHISVFRWVCSFSSFFSLYFSSFSPTQNNIFASCASTLHSSNRVEFIVCKGWNRIAHLTHYIAAKEDDDDDDDYDEEKKIIRVQNEKKYFLLNLIDWRSFLLDEMYVYEVGESMSQIVWTEKRNSIVIVNAAVFLNGHIYDFSSARCTQHIVQNVFVFFHIN